MKHFVKKMAAAAAAGIMLAVGTLPAMANSVDYLPFRDVPKTEWYYDAVAYNYKWGLMQGMGSGEFCPQNSMTRAMVVQILYNREEKPAVSESQSAFTDVAANKWYFKAIQWAYKNGYANGFGNGTFLPEKQVTREEIVQFLYNYTGKPTPTGSLTGFGDQDSVTWSKNAMQWAVGSGYVNGIPNGTRMLLQPKGNATRAQAATILRAYCQKEYNAYRGLLTSMKTNGDFLQYAGMRDLNGDGVEELLVIYNANQFALYEYKNGAPTVAARYQFIRTGLDYFDEPCTDKTWKQLKAQEEEGAGINVSVDLSTNVLNFQDMCVTSWNENNAQLYYENGKWVLNTFYLPEPGSSEAGGKYIYYVNGREVSESEYWNTWKPDVNVGFRDQGIEDRLSAMLY